MRITNEFVVSRVVYTKNNPGEAEENRLFIAELAETDSDSNNIEFVIHDENKSTYITFRFDDLKRLVENNDPDFC